VLLPGVDKSSGLVGAVRALDLARGAVAGSATAVGDVAWLRRCGVSFAPAGAGAEVKQVVTRVSPFDDAAAVLEAYRALVAANRTLSGRRGQGGSGEAGRAG
jgi:3-deoxy-D-manno-octulosonate 8-phosphate phosphatase KdsC-like HAD superfamily phosphatase